MTGDFSSENMSPDRNGITYFSSEKKRSGNSESYETDSKIAGANHRCKMDLDLNHTSYIQI